MSSAECAVRLSRVCDWAATKKQDARARAFRFLCEDAPKQGAVLLDHRVEQRLRVLSGHGCWRVRQRSAAEVHVHSAGETGVQARRRRKWTPEAKEPLMHVVAVARPWRARRAEVHCQQIGQSTSTCPFTSSSDDFHAAHPSLGQQGKSFAGAQHARQQQVLFAARASEADASVECATRALREQHSGHGDEQD